MSIVKAVVIANSLVEDIHPFIFEQMKYTEKFDNLWLKSIHAEQRSLPTLLTKGNTPIDSTLGLENKPGVTVHCAIAPFEYVHTGAVVTRKVIYADVPSQLAEFQLDLTAHSIISMFVPMQGFELLFSHCNVDIMRSPIKLNSLVEFNLLKVRRPKTYLSKPERMYMFIDTVPKLNIGEVTYVSSVDVIPYAMVYMHRTPVFHILTHATTLFPGNVRWKTRNWYNRNDESYKSVVKSSERWNIVGPLAFPLNVELSVRSLM